MKSKKIIMKICFDNLFLLLVAGNLVGVAGATSLSGDLNAISGYKGTASFSEYLSNGTKIEATVDYAVYDKGKYSGYVPLGLETKYIYAYQVFNGTSSNISLDFFSVGLKLGAIDLATDQSWEDSTYAYAVAGGISSTIFMNFIGSPAKKAGFAFFAAPIGVGQYSKVLLFSSDHEPIDHYGIVAGGALGKLPSPIPEPTTIILFSSLIPFAIKKRKMKVL